MFSGNFCFVSNEVPFTSLSFFAFFLSYPVFIKAWNFFATKRLFIFRTVTTGCQPELKLTKTRDSSLQSFYFCSCFTGNLNEYSMTALFLNPVFYNPLWIYPLF